MDGSGRSILVTFAKMENAGKYECQIGDSERSYPVQLWVSYGPVILQVPPMIYEGDTIDIRCHSYSTMSRLTFYKDRKVIKHSGKNELRLDTIQLKGTGAYKCDGKLYYRAFTDSDTTYIYVKELFTWPSINVFPLTPVEGDDVTLTCDTSLSPNKFTELAFAFYRDRKNIRGFDSSSRYEIQSIKMEDSGTYLCEVRTPTDSVKKLSPPLHIHILELLPHVNVSVNPMTEGDPMAMVCYTNLTPRTSSRLRFSFLRDGIRIQEFGPSNKYEIISVRPEDSGNYSCLVKMSPDSPWRTSNTININIEAKKSSRYLHKILIQALLMLLIMTAILLFLWRHKVLRCTRISRWSRTDTTVSETQMLENTETATHKKKTGGLSEEEDDVVYTHIRFIPNRKATSSGETSYDVIYAAVKTNIKH